MFADSGRCEDCFSAEWADFGWWCWRYFPPLGDRAKPEEDEAGKPKNSNAEKEKPNLLGLRHW